MKILQINTTVNSGSTGRIAEDIGKIFISSGHESFIAYGRGNQASESNLIRIGNKIDMYLHGFKSLLTDRHGFGSKLATKKLIQEIELIKPDIIGIHNIHGYYLNIELFFEYIKKEKIPILWTFHDCWPLTGHCAFMLCDNCKNCQDKYPKSIFLNQSSRNFKDKKRIFSDINKLKIITPSKWLKNIVENSFFNCEVVCINNGIDLDQFKFSTNCYKLNDKLDLQSKKVILGVASTWDERKGLLDFIKLSNIISKEFRIILIGLNKKQIKHLPNNIIGITRTESIAELANYYSIADVFINPTYADNFPTTNLEALACGTPVITYDTGGSPEAIDHKTGVTVAQGDINGLKDAINLIVSSATHYSRRICRERAEKFYKKEDRFKDYLTIYEKLIS